MSISERNDTPIVSCHVLAKSKRGVLSSRLGTSAGMTIIPFHGNVNVIVFISQHNMIPIFYLLLVLFFILCPDFS